MGPPPERLRRTPSRGRRQRTGKAGSAASVGQGRRSASTTGSRTMAEARLHDAITDVAGLTVGHFTHPARATGCSVVLCPDGAVAGVDVRGGAPGTRETDLLAPENLIDRVHALLLTGGSAFGLDAVGGVRVPIVPAAVLFDLWHGDLSIRPDAAAGYAACEAASDRRPAQGNVGAGAGA